MGTNYKSRSRRRLWVKTSTFGQTEKEEKALGMSKVEPRKNMQDMPIVTTAYLGEVSVSKGYAYAFLRRHQLRSRASSFAGS